MPYDWLSHPGTQIDKRQSDKTLATWYAVTWRTIPVDHKFPTQHDAMAFILACDAAGRIIGLAA